MTLRKRKRANEPVPTPVSAPKPYIHGYVSKRFFIAICGKDWTTDKNIDDGPFHVGQALRRVTNNERGKSQNPIDGDLWAQYWKLSSSDTQIDRDDPYAATERYLTDSWVLDQSLGEIPLWACTVTVWLDLSENHIKIAEDGSIVFNEETCQIVRDEVLKLKVYMLHIIMLFICLTTLMVV
jgi:hypothetical protein